MRHIEGAGGLIIGGHALNNLRYADDNVLVNSKLDYCNSLLNGLPNSPVVQLQHVIKLFGGARSMQLCKISFAYSHSREKPSLASYHGAYTIQDCFFNL